MVSSMLLLPRLRWSAANFLTVSFETLTVVDSPKAFVQV